MVGRVSGELRAELTRHPLLTIGHPDARREIAHARKHPLIHASACPIATLMRIHPAPLLGLPDELSAMGDHRRASGRIELGRAACLAARGGIKHVAIGLIVERELTAQTMNARDLARALRFFPSRTHDA